MGITGTERVQAALRLDRADRAPVSAWGHTYDREWDPGELVGTTVGIARRCGLDFVKLQIRMTCFAEAFGGRWRYSGSPEREPVMEAAGAADAAGWRRLVETGAERAVLEEQVGVLRAVTSELGAEVPLIQTVFSPGMVAWFLCGRDLGRLQALLRAEPELLRSGLDAIARTLAWFSAASLEAGAAGVFYAINPVADTDAFAPAEYERLLAPHDRTALEGAAAGWFNMLHLCGPRINQELVRALRPHCVNWSTGDPGNPGLAELRDRHGVAVVGGLHREHPIRTGTPAEVRAEAAAALEETGGRGHLLAPGCSVSPWPLGREDNIRALGEAAAAA